MEKQTLKNKKFIYKSIFGGQTEGIIDYETYGETYYDKDLYSLSNKRFEVYDLPKGELFLKREHYIVSTVGVKYKFSEVFIESDPLTNPFKGLKW